MPAKLNLPEGYDFVPASTTLSASAKNPGPSYPEFLDPLFTAIRSVMSGEDSSDILSATGDEVIYNLIDSDDNLWATFKFTPNEGFEVIPDIDHDQNKVSSTFQLIPNSLYFEDDDAVYCPIFEAAETGQQAHPGIYFYYKDTNNHYKEITDEADGACKSMDQLADELC